MSSFEDQYQAVMESAGLLDLSNRGKILATGPDHVSFLHSMLTNDVENLGHGSGRHAAFLTSTGKLVATFHFYKLADSVLIDVDGSLAAKLIETLERFIIMDEVALENVSSDWSHLSLQGPSACRIATEVLGTEVPAAELALAPAVHEGASGWIVRRGSLASAGCELIFPAGAGRELKRGLVNTGGVTEVGPQVAETLRVERGTPRFGVDMDETNYPMEARLDDAISFTKGCYIGQEVVAKATYIGGVNRLLVRLRLEGSAIPPQGAAVLEPGGKSVGAVTSAVRSPRLGRSIALGYVRRNFAGSGARLQVELADGSRVAAETVDSFFPG